ncbi:MAG TPA: 3-dehydroquinate synthase [Chloroflexota bacterium]
MTIVPRPSPRHRAAPASDLPPIEQRVEVSFRYRVLFTEHVFAADNPMLAEVMAATSDTQTPSKFLCIVEDGVASHQAGLIPSITGYAKRYREFVDLAEQPIVVPGGERVKNHPHLVDQIHEAINRAGIDRHSYVVAVGGGALLDMVGYAAATAHRGVRLIRIPTTVLAQADSGVGVKNSINAFGKKNFLGTFAPPAAVINDTRFLETLSDREWRSGIAEAIKVMLLKDRDAFEELEGLAPALARRDMDAMRRVVYRAAQLHLQHIATSGDPFELGSSRPLDMGHWSAHKLESLSTYRLLHGEAVAIGLALDATYAHEVGLLDDITWRRIMRVLETVGLPTYAPELSQHLDEPEHPGSILRGLVEFREHLGGQLTVMLPLTIGRGMEVHTMDLDVVRSCIAMLRVGLHAE